MGRAKNGEGSVSGPDARGYYHFKVHTKVIKPNGAVYVVHTTSTISAEDAKKKGLKKKREVERQEKLGTTGKYTGKETFAFWVREYMEFKHTHCVSKNRWTDSTYTSYNNLMNPHFFKKDNKLKSLQFHNLTVKAFQEYFDLISQENEDGKSLGLKNRQNIRSVMIKTIDFINNQGYDLDNFAAQAYVLDPKRDEVDINYAGEEEEIGKTFFDDDDIKKIWDGVQSNIFKYGYGYALMLCTGIRSQELFGITNDLITISEDEKSGSIKICKAVGKRRNSITGKRERYLKVTKNTDTRMVYLDEVGVECVKKLRQAMKMHNTNVQNDKNLLIYDSFGNFVELDVFNSEFHRFCIRFNIDLPERRGAHMLRHTFITINNVKYNINPIITAKAAGHKDLSTDINVYSHVSEEDIRRQIVNPLQQDVKKEDMTSEQLLQLKEIYEKLKLLFE